MTTTQQGPLYAVTALFETPDAILHAAGATREAGYTAFDVHTPYPVHGMDRAMGQRPTRLGVFALVFGLLGTVSAIGLMTWVTLVDYPLVIGGKPFWSWPAFVPVAFEVTVLMASVLTVLTMIVLYFKFPNTAHPLLDTPYMKRVSSDRFGLAIQASDPKFDERAAREFLASLGSRDVSAVHYDPVEHRHAPKLFEAKFVGLRIGVILVTAGATYLMLNVVLYLPPFNWMMNQEKLKPQKPSVMFADGIGMRTPVAGTVARGFLPYAYAGQPDSAGKYLANPLPATEPIVERGRQKFRTFCSPCHGNFGRGDSRLAGQFPNPPTLHSDKVRQWPDGNIYHVITEGQNVMPAYASQIARDDRWAIIHYIRVLERAHNAQEADLR